jgi:hypothetical protein
MKQSHSKEINMESFDIEKNRTKVETSQDSKITWFHSDENIFGFSYTVNTENGADPNEIWEGETDYEGVRFDMYAIRDGLYCLNTYYQVLWGAESEYQLDLSDYTYVDTIEDGFDTAEQILNSLKGSN